MKWVPGYYEETDEEIIIPKVGDKIYVSCSDGFVGGWGEIIDVKIDNRKTILPCNRIMVEVKENPGTWHNYLHLIEEYEENSDKTKNTRLSENFGGKDIK